MSTELITVEQRDRVGLITLNRPKALNALNTELGREVLEAARAFDADPGIGAIVLTGSAKAFAAGADIAEMAPKGYAELRTKGLFAEWDALESLRKPLIAAVGGYALGGGCELAMACDLIIAADTAVFGQPEITLGILPGMGGSQRLTRAVGKSLAMDMILTGRRLKADEALAAGLVARVVPADELLDRALEVAATIAGHSLPAVVAAKAAVNEAFEATLSAGLRSERQAFYAAFSTEDQKEGMGAFLEKRTPSWRQR